MKGLARLKAMIEAVEGSWYSVLAWQLDWAKLAEKRRAYDCNLGPLS